MKNIYLNIKIKKLLKKMRKVVLINTETKMSQDIESYIIKYNRHIIMVKFKGKKS